MQDIKSKIESDGDSQITDLHLWNVAPGRLAAIVSVISHEQRQVDEYKLRLNNLGLAHVTVELIHCER
jgi:Co/Zn/Cd efflux system component